MKNPTFSPESKSKAPTKKKRTPKRPAHLVTQACDFCKRRHMKCDGKSPCFQCSKRKQDCIYSEARKRGPKPKVQKLVAGDISLSSCPPHLLVKEIEKLRSEVQGWKQKYRKLQHSFDMFAAQSLNSEREEREEDLGHENNNMNPLQLSSASPSGKEGEELNAEAQRSLQASASKMKEFLSRVENKKYVGVYKNFILPVFPMLRTPSLTDGTSDDEELKISDKNDPASIVESLEYSIACTLGARLCQDKTREKKFAHSVASLTWLLLKKTGYIDQSVGKRMVECLLLMGYYYFGGGELDRALIATMTAYSIFLLHRNSLSHTTIQRLYTWIIGTSSDPRMRENWFNMADTECSFIPNPGRHRLSQTIVYLNFIFVGEGSKTIFFDVKLTDENTRTFQKILSWMTQLLVEVESAFEKKEIIERKYLTRTIVIRSCRARARHILGQKEEAHIDAIQAIKCSQALKTKTCNLGVPMTLSYSIKVCKDMADSFWFNEGIRQLDTFSPIYPLIIHYKTHFLNDSPQVEEEIPINRDPMSPLLEDAEWGLLGQASLENMPDIAAWMDDSTLLF